MEINSNNSEVTYTRVMPRLPVLPASTEPPVPDQVDLSPQALGDPPSFEASFKPYKPPAEFQGRPPLPQKFDFHCYQAGTRVAADARALERTFTRSLTGRLPGFQDTTAMAATNYGTNNQCANFVSTFARRLGLKGHYLVVPELENALQKQGWKRVSAAEARPGDVWISDSHTELVTGREQGQPRVTGSNNNRRSYQTISGHPQSAGRFYTRPLWRQQY